MSARAMIPAAVGSALMVVLGLVASDGSLLPALLLFSALVQGTIALAAAAELSKGRWILPARRAMLSLHPMMLPIAVGFIVFSKNLSVYGWTEYTTAWLSPIFFVLRNVALLVLTWLVAWQYAKASLSGSENAKKLALWYALVFVLNQTVIAFDWVMSFEYPWISTLFGGYFFIEALYAGIAVGAFVTMRLMARGRAERSGTFLDFATLMFGFALLWAGQLFAQYLVIWYGNIPEEQSFLVSRVTEYPLRELSILVVLFLFVIPFTVLLSRELKTRNLVTGAMGALVISGILIERLIFLIPVVELDPLMVALAVAALGIPFVTTLQLGLKEPVAEAVTADVPADPPADEVPDSEPAFPESRD